MSTLMNTTNAPEAELSGSENLRGLAQIKRGRPFIDPLVKAQNLQRRYAEHYLKYKEVCNKSSKRYYILKALEKPKHRFCSQNSEEVRNQILQEKPLIKIGRPKKYQSEEDRKAAAKLAMNKWLAKKRQEKLAAQVQRQSSAVELNA